MAKHGPVWGYGSSIFCLVTLNVMPTKHDMALNEAMLRRLENANRPSGFRPTAAQSSPSKPTSNAANIHQQHSPPRDAAIDDAAGSRLLSRLEGSAAGAPSRHRSPSRSSPARTRGGDDDRNSRSGLSGTAASRQKAAFEAAMLQREGKAFIFLSNVYLFIHIPSVYHPPRLPQIATPQLPRADPPGTNALQA